MYIYIYMCLLLPRCRLKAPAGIWVVRLRICARGGPRIRHRF